MEHLGYEATQGLRIADAPKVFERGIADYAAIGVEHTETNQEENEIDADSSRQWQNVAQRHGSTVVEPKDEDAWEIGNQQVSNEDAPIREGTPREVPFRHTDFHIH